MRLYELLNIDEAPIGNFQTFGDWSDSTTHLPPKDKVTSTWYWDEDNAKNSFVSKIDRKMIQDVGIQTKVRKYFDAHDIMFHVYAVNSPEMKHFHDNLDFSEISPTSPSWDKFPEELIEVLSRNKDDSIQIVLTHNEGGMERHALTPWIICHRMAHALMGSVFSNDVGRVLVSEFKKSLINVSQYYQINQSQLSPGEKQEFLKNMFPKISTFKSARDEEIDEFEIFVETLTQYFVKGKVTLKAPPASVKIYDDIATVTNELEALEEIKRLQDWYNAEAKKSLESCVGSIFVC